MNKISVIIPVYNADRYLKEALDSIINQTYTDFELLIFNDGSTDNSLTILESYQTDKRVKVYHSEKNEGLVYQLNQGIKLASGEYIARMDSDDICDPERFKKQITLLDSNPDLALCGTCFSYINKHGEIQNQQLMPLSNEEVKASLFFYTSVLHPSVMVRTEVIKEFYYDKAYYPAEDYHIWNLIAESHKIANLKDNLIYYRIHDSNIGSLRQKEQEILMQKTQKKLLEKLGISGLSEEMMENHYSSTTKAYWGNVSGIKNKERSLLWLDVLYKSNKVHKVYDESYFYEYLKKCWLSIIKINQGTSASASFRIYNSSFNKNLDMDSRISFTHLIKSLF